MVVVAPGLGKHGFYDGLERRQVLGHRLQNPPVAHLVVGVAQDVAEVGDAPPIDVGVFILQRLGNMAGSFRQSFEIPLDRGGQVGIAAIVVERLAGHQSLDRADR